MSLFSDVLKLANNYVAEARTTAKPRISKVREILDAYIAYTLEYVHINKM